MRVFESELENYPGSFSLPEPFLERHMRAWWEKAIKPLKGLTAIDYEFYDAEWHGAVVLITQFGSWDIEAIPVGDLDTDNMPMEVKSWVMEEASSYILPFLPPKVKLKAFGIT